MDDVPDETSDLDDALVRLQLELNAFDRTTSSELGVGTLDDLALLRVLERNGPARVSTLARRTRRTTATVSARLDRLERRGLVERLRRGDDRRAVVVSLTPQGQEAATEDRARRIQAMEAATAQPSPTRITSLAAAIAPATANGS